MQPNSLRLPVIAAPMFLLSQVELVVACCNAGIVGSMPALNLRTTEALDTAIGDIKSQIPKGAPYAINLIVHPSNPRVQADLAVIVKHQVPIVITSLGAVSELVQAVNTYGGKVFHDVTTLRHAEKAIAAGVDGIIAVSAGAGGHAGTVNPMALIDEIRAIYDGTLILGGAINKGHQVLAAQAMGADFAYMGTRFINSQESEAGDDYRQMILDSYARDVAYTDQVSGIPGSFLIPSLKAAGIDPQIWGQKSVDLGKELTAPEDGAKAWKTLWSAGQGVGGIDDVPTVAELVARLEQEYQSAKQRLTEF